jgi:diguanylate cyclase (GGDEF)-like protein/PAS domain S-box-containing protein
MKLKTKFFILMAGVFCVFTVTVGWYSRHLLTQINEQWGGRYAEKQVLFDKHRTLLPLLREIAVARQMAAEPALLEMALHEDDAAIRKRGLETLERYRLKFEDHSYFAAMVKSGHYYYNDADNKYIRQQLRYTLSPRSADDRWFYATVASQLDYQINVDPDVHLGNTKVWINVSLKHNDEVVGIIGTGLDITQFIKESVAFEQPGILNLFVDRDLAVQLYRDPNLIDYASITKAVEKRRKVDALLTDPADIENLRAAMRRLASSTTQVATLWVTFEGKKHLLGIAYLPEIGWFDLTLIDSNSLMLLNDIHIAPLLILIFLAALFAVGVMLHRLVLKPIYKLGKSVEQVEQGNYEIDPPQLGSGEIAHLSAQFRAMVAVVRNTKRELEEKVVQRTEQLSQELAERKRAEDELRSSETLLRTLYDTTSDAVMLLTDHGFFNCNKATLKMFGCATEAEFCTKHPGDLSPPTQPCGGSSMQLANQNIATAMKNGSIRFEWMHMRADNGKVFPAEVLLNAMNLNGKLVLQAVVRDISERKKSEEQIRNFAFYDDLTCLPNRRMLYDRLAQTMAASKRHGCFAALMVLDLDHFKPLNDKYGHAVGDLLLIEVAHRLRSCVREMDTVARFGGDEFVVMLSELERDQDASTAQAGIIAEKIRTILAEPYLLMVRREGAADVVVEHHCSSSIGVVVFASHEAKQDDIFEWADAAMYQAKAGGRNQIHFHGMSVDCC